MKQTTESVHNFLDDNPEKGAGAILVFLGVLTVMSLVLFNFSDSLDYQSVINKQGSEADRFTSTLFNNIHNALADPSKCGSNKAKINSFRDFSKSVDSFEVSGSSTAPCMVGSDELRWIKEYTIRLQDLENNQNLLFKDVRVSVAVETKKIRGLRSRNFYRSKILRISMMSLDKFGLIFHGNAGKRFVSNGPIVDVTTSVMDTSKTPKKLDNFYYEEVKPKVRFMAPVYLRSENLTQPIDGGDMAGFRTIFLNGLYTNVFPSSQINQYLPNGSNPWNYGIDYFFKFDDAGPPLPEVKGSSSSVGCDPAMSYDAGRGKIDVIPSPTNYEIANESCQEPDQKMMVINQASKNLRLNLQQLDNVFCGVIAAKELQINLSAPGDYAIYGLFNVVKIIVNGPAGATLYIHNPQDNIPENVELPNNMTQMMLANNMRELASTTARNFFVPMTPKSSLKPITADKYLSPSCGSSYTYDLQYKPLHEMIEYKAAQIPDENALYLIREVM